LLGQRLGVDGLKLRVDAVRRRNAHLDVQVAGAVLTHARQQTLDRDLTLDHPHSPFRARRAGAIARPRPPPGARGLAAAPALAPRRPPGPAAAGESPSPQRTTESPPAARQTAPAALTADHRPPDAPRGCALPRI